MFQFELKEMQRRQEEEERKRRGAAKGPPPGERMETTFPAGPGAHETTLGPEGGMLIFLVLGTG